MLHGNKVTSNSRRKSILREDVIHLKSFDFHFKIIHQRTIGLTWCNCGKSWKLKGYIMCRRLYGSPHREINLPTPVSHKQTEQLELRFSTKKSRIAWVWNKWTAGVCRDWLRGLRLSPFSHMELHPEMFLKLLMSGLWLHWSRNATKCCSKTLCGKLALYLLAEELSTVKWCILFITAWQVKAGNL